MLKLLVDDRESKVIPFFATCGSPDIEIKVSRIQTGDYAIYYGETILFIIERKSWKDLSASIKDGRKENTAKLLALREKTGCKIIYLIEGRARYAPTQKIARIPYKNLQAHLDHLVIRDNIYIIYSSSFEDSARRIVEFAHNYISLGIFPTCPEPPQKALEALTEITPKSDTQIVYSIWGCVPSVTDKTTSLFIDAYHISDLILGVIRKEDIGAMRYPSGAIIGKRANKIAAIQDIHNPANFKYYCNMLGCITGITKKTATMILSEFGMHALLSGQVSQDALANLQKTPKARLGPKAAEKVLKYFVKAAAANETRE
jgi:ERCC4-type nuclease